MADKSAPARGIEIVDTQIQGAMNEHKASVPICAAGVHVSDPDAHATKANRANCETASAKYAHSESGRKTPIRIGGLRSRLPV